MDRNRFVQLRKSAIIIQQILRVLIRGRKRLQNKLGSMWIHWKLLLLSAVHILSFELGACGTLWAVRNH